ncbi:hypothetical protein MQX03_07660 [Chryseobacterium aahli]|uniref:hypothetical protein n=1 Tax=Chryseobacterium aahli TaxID=1278643 RepID=UPI001F617E45|nr:hypothetical protein [Chryseobacterium aahli]MCI3937072.1 hypothetical protein [Chryseobacterium aahli]
MDFKKLLTKYNDKNPSENFVAIATKIYDRKAYHAGIIIRYKNKDYLHHYPGGNQSPLVEEDFDGNDWYIYKSADFVSDNEYEVASFLQYCRRVCKNSTISYGYFTDGSKYDQQGKFVSKNELPEIGTCVGFCINTLTGAILDIKDNMFELDDWDDSEIPKFYDTKFREDIKDKYPDLDWDLYNVFRKRITPIEYLCSSFFDSFPIRKDEISDIIIPVQAVIDQKFAS